MKTLKINVPEGYEVDQEKSTFEEIVFKVVEKKLPKSWEELGRINGHWVDDDSNILSVVLSLAITENSNIFATESQAKASIALAQLSQLREVYRQGWEPHWNDTNEPKYCIKRIGGMINTRTYFGLDTFLSFQSPEIRDEFFKNFKYLIEEASPLLFG